MRKLPIRRFSAAARRPIPLIDLSQPPELAAREIHEACRSVGFFQIFGHGVPETLRARMLSESACFFSLPQRSKDELSIWRSADKVRGYQRIHENVTQGAADWHEGFDCYAESPLASAHHGANLWPAEQPSLRSAVAAYVLEMRRVGGLVTSLMAQSLGLPPDHFAPFYDNGFWGLRAIHYPPAAATREQSEAGPELGCGVHTDYGCLTLLHSDETPGALQAQATDGTWIDIEPTPGAFVCNIGDMMARWTNGLYRATPHRVLRPAAGARISIPFFFEPNYDAVIAPLPRCCELTSRRAMWPPVVYGEHLLAKTSSNFAAA